MKKASNILLILVGTVSLVLTVSTVFIATAMGKGVDTVDSSYKEQITSENLNLKPKLIYSDSIPQGRMIYELYFAEFGGQMGNLPVEISITENNIIVYNNEENPLTGGIIIIEGILIKHKSGKWIIGEKETDREAEDIGGCSDGPVPIDFGTKIIEWC